MQAKPIVIPYHIKQSFVNSHPEWIFLYGYDVMQRGALGQCVSFIGEDNAFPIYTMYKYCANAVYFRDDEDSLQHMQRSFDYIPRDGRPIIPCRKMGQGCSRMQEFAPKLFKQLQTLLLVHSYSSIQTDYTHAFST